LKNELFTFFYKTEHILGQIGHSSGCANAKKTFSIRGLCPDSLTRGSTHGAPGDSVLDPIIGSRLMWSPNSGAGSASGWVGVFTFWWVGQRWIWQCVGFVGSVYKDKMSTIAEIARFVPDKPYIAKHLLPSWATVLSLIVRVYSISEFDSGGSESCRFVRNNSKWRTLGRSRSFKVTNVGIDRKPVCDFLSVN